MNKAFVRPKIAILISGRGSNMQVILERVKDGSLPVEIVLVFSDNPEAEGLQIAKTAGVVTAAFSPSEFEKFSIYEEKVVNILKQAQAEWVICAGYMRIIKKTILSNYQGKILNIHPALLPSFRGLNAQKQALESGVKISGCTVHFVDEGVDSGPIIAQTAVDVFDEDTVADLTKRILKAEHETYWKAIKKITINS